MYRHQHSSPRILGTQYKTFFPLNIVRKLAATTIIAELPPSMLGFVVAWVVRHYSYVVMTLGLYAGRLIVAQAVTDALRIEISVDGMSPKTLCHRRDSFGICHLASVVLACGAATVAIYTVIRVVFPYCSNHQFILQSHYSQAQHIFCSQPSLAAPHKLCYHSTARGLANQDKSTMQLNILFLTTAIIGLASAVPVNKIVITAREQTGPIQPAPNEPSFLLCIAKGYCHA